ncbi:MAG: hypothetical protein WD097_10095 [Balneolales bacterium]
MKIICALAVLSVLMLPPEAPAQVSQGDVRVEIDMMPSLTRTQTLSLATLGIDAQGAGSRLMNLVIENTTDELLSGLFLYVRIESSGLGSLSHIDQRQGWPFSLNPGQVVIANNNDLQNGLPGVSEDIHLRAELTDAGENFINNLEGSTTLPDRVYTVHLEIYHGNNRKYNGNLIASTSVTLPVEEMFTEVGFDLLAPGAEAGAPLERTNSRPVFRWEGSSSRTFRLVIVEQGEGQSAQSLIREAMDTNPVIGETAAGELLDFEMADVLVSGNSFTYPASRVQPLQPGSTYYWQVFAHIDTPTGTELHPSPVWQFAIRRSGPTMTEMDEEILDLVNLFLPERYRDLFMDGYKIESAEIDGRSVSGAQLLMEIEQFVDNLENDRIRLVD